jgi:hypothetical protein
MSLSHPYPETKRGSAGCCSNFEINVVQALHQLRHCVALPPLGNQSNLDLMLLARIPARTHL